MRVSLTDEQRKQTIVCACGCRGIRLAYDGCGVPRRFIKGHGKRGWSGKKERVAKCIKLSCDFCGKEFLRGKSELSVPSKHRFCSRRCGASFYHPEHLLKSSKARIKPDAKFTFSCPTCGKKVTRYRSTHRGTHTPVCSNKCQRHRPESKRKISASHKKRMMEHRATLISKPHKLFIQLFKNKFGVDLEVEFALMLDNGSRKYYDCKMPGMSVIFEIDGLYWHSRPDQQANDLIKDRLAEKLGYTLYRIPEDKVVEFVSMFSLPIQCENVGREAKNGFVG